MATPELAAFPDLSATWMPFDTKMWTVSGFVRFFAVQRLYAMSVLGEPIGLARRAVIEQVGRPDRSIRTTQPRMSAHASGPRAMYRPRPLRHYFCLISRSLRTSLTPSTERASSPALVFMVVESTNPVSCTTPFSVPTLIW